VRTVSPHRKIDGSGALADICPSPLPASPCWSRRRRSSASEVVSTSACPTTPGYRRFSVACEAVRGTPVRIRLRRSRCFPAETDRSPAGRDSASRDAAIIFPPDMATSNLDGSFLPHDDVQTLGTRFRTRVAVAEAASSARPEYPSVSPEGSRSLILRASTERDGFYFEAI
jgi:hypothetical protein